MAGMKRCCSRISQKWVFIVMGFFSIYCGFAMRMTLSFTIPQMVKSEEKTQEFLDDSCPSTNFNFSETSTNNTINLKGTYDWSEYTQGIILGSFYWGYVLSHVPGGMLAEHFGGKHTVGYGILLTGLFTLATPEAIRWGGSTALVLLRVLMGVSEGITQPGMSVMLSHWIPAEERSRVTSFVFMGSTLGVLSLSMGLGPAIRLMDWPGVYYLFGALGVLWFLLWVVLCYNNPAEHPFISEEESRELEDKLKKHCSLDHHRVPPVPWKHLLTSGPFWALVAGSVGRDWGGYTLVSDLPKYLVGVLKFDLDESSLLFTVIYASNILAAVLFSLLSDWLIITKRFSRTNTRKLMASIALGIQTFVMLADGYVGCDKIVNSIILVASFVLMGAGFPGIKANVLDLSPNYAGTVMAVSHGLAGLCGIGGPYIVGLLVPDQTLQQWRSVFWVITLVTVTTNIIFIFYASGEVQRWNDPKFDRNKKKYEFTELKDVNHLFVPTTVDFEGPESSS